MRPIVLTTSVGGVAVVVPTTECMAFLTNGGAPEGYFGRVDKDEHIDRWVRAGLRERTAVRWINVIFSGGLTDAEAFDLIADKDSPQGSTARELCDWSDLPDRWFRDAWRRSHNGGPIIHDLDSAKQIHFRRIADAAKNELEPTDITSVRQKILSAKSIAELRAVA